MSDTSDPFLLPAMIYAEIQRIGDRSLVTRKEFEALLTAARAEYQANIILYKALHDLERLASSWSGNPQAQPAIRAARKALTAYVIYDPRRLR